MYTENFSTARTLENGAFQFFHKANRVDESTQHTTPHVHDKYEIYLFQEGSIRCTVEGNIYDISPDDLLITSPRELHRPLVEPPCFYRRKRMMFSPAFLSPFFTHAYSPLAFFDNRRPGTCNKISGRDAKAHGLIDLIEKIEGSIRDEAPSGAVMVKVYLMELLFGMSKLIVSTAPDAAPSSDLVKDLLLYINNHIGDDLRYEALAARFHMSPNSLHRLFVQNTGFAPGEYIQGRRIIKAKGLLLGGVPAQKAAGQVGFSEYSTFYRAFVKHTGMSPAKFGKTSK